MEQRPERGDKCSDPSASWTGVPEAGPPDHNSRLTTTAASPPLNDPKAPIPYALTVPLGPIETPPEDVTDPMRTPPQAQRDARRRVLLEALGGMMLGAHDRHILARLVGCSDQLVLTVASWLQRTRAAERERALWGSSSERLD
jgi:hypothetical protein